MEGIKTTQNGDFCIYCNAKVNVNLYNFCPKCGNALTIEATNLKEQQNRKLRLEILDELASSIQNTEALAEIMKKIKEV